MFEQMVSELKKGILPEISLLRKRFNLALVKKLGVIKTPCSFWTSDKKINPATKELLWAAILLEDRDNYMLVEGILATEIEEKRKASGLSHAPVSGPVMTESFINELIHLGPSEQFRQLLQQKVDGTTS